MTLLPRLAALIVVASLASISQVRAADDAEKLRAEVHELRAKANQLHDQALKEIDEADTKQSESDKDFKEAAALEKKADEAEHVSAEVSRARALRIHGHQDERQAESLEANAKVHLQRAQRDEEHVQDAQQVLTDLKSKNAPAEETKLLEEDASDHQKKAKAERDGAKEMQDQAAKLKKNAAELLAQADKLDPKGKDKDREEHPKK